ncbi:MAG: OmpA family protein [Deltaproteobacteria bacterium]|nr:OmpA family protein [Deltaproteobacteria bacterium]
MSGTGTPTPIIIKKVKKGGHGGAQGGSWKVAYADFVTAMMAFFLLLWLISMVSDEKKAQVSQYFKEFSLFEKGGQSFMMDSQISENQFMIIDSGESDSEQEKTGSDESSDSQGDGVNGSESSVEDTANSMNERLKIEIESKLSNMKDQILVDIDDGASRIEVIDKKGGMLMFSLGSKEMSPEGKKALGIIAESIKEIKGKIAIEGHTDSSQYAGTQYSNWELSTERASSARKELESNGVSPDKFIRVAGYADTDPLIKEDTLDPKNRRISIRVFPEKLPDNPLPADESQSKRRRVIKGGKNSKKEQNTDEFDPVGRYLLNK